MAADSARDDAAPVIDAAEAAAPYTEIASGMPDLAGIDVSATKAFVIQHDSGAIRALDFAGGLGPPQTLNANALAPSAILAFDDNIVWADYGHQTLTTYSLAGASAFPITPSDSFGPSALARAPVGASFLSPTAGSGGDGSVIAWTGSRPLAQAGVVYSAGPGANLFDVAMTVTTAYWTESAKATVWQRPFDLSAAPSPVASGENGCESVAADDAGVYWTLPVGTVRARVTSSLGSTTLAEGEQVPFSLAVDASGLYWLTEDGKLRRSRRDGTSAETLAAGFSSRFADRHVQAIALTASYVLWITTDGRVLRLAK